MKAISTTIATVILISVALILAITAATYILSTITPIQEKSLETLMIKGDSYITKNENSYVLHLHLYSNIKPRLILYALEIASKHIELTTDNVKIITCESGKAEITSDGLILTPGTDVWIEVTINDSLNIGNYVNIKICSKAGYIYQGILTFK